MAEDRAGRGALLLQLLTSFSATFCAAIDGTSNQARAAAASRTPHHFLWVAAPSVGGSPSVVGSPSVGGSPAQRLLRALASVPSPFRIWQVHEEGRRSAKLFGGAPIGQIFRHDFFGELQARPNTALD